MGITYNPATNIFHLCTERTSYLILLYRNTYPLHLHWGRRVWDDDCGWALEAPYRRQSLLLGKEPDDPMCSLEYLPFEYPCYGTSDFRPPACQVEGPEGGCISCPVYTGYEILDGKPPIPGLPAVYCQEQGEAQTLVLHLLDHLLGLHIDLYYTVLPGYDLIARHTAFRNAGDAPLTLRTALSMSLDIKKCPDELLQLSGTALRETQVVRRPLDSGYTGFESTRGYSSHQHNPFGALVNRDTGEDRGEAFGVSLVYSGNFIIQANRDMYRGARFQAGINPFGFGWRLEPGAQFHTPEALLVYSDHGLNGMSQTFHRVLRERLARGRFRDAVRPVLLNTWEANYFDFTHDSVMALARAAQETGVELLVLDDGWFGHRDDSCSSLGDWVENRSKLPLGLKGLAQEVNELGLRFGLWFEPEMVSPDSDLYRTHPDWCIHTHGRKRTEWRSQLVLDLSRDEVCDYIIESLTRVLHSANIEYVKWDCNRRMTEVDNPMLPHRYLLNLYRILETLTSRFPQVLWENCASGGGRFDPAMLYYFSQNWATDNTDAICRLGIQYGATMVYPPVWITSHVSASPNHQTQRETPLEFRGQVCAPFNLGYELNLLPMSQEERSQVAEQIADYKEIRSLVQFGTFTRLMSPFEGPDTAWMVSAPDSSEFIVWYYKPHADTEESPVTVKLSGIQEQRWYRLAEEDGGRLYHGSLLCGIGLPLDWKNGDCFCQRWHFVAAPPK